MPHRLTTIEVSGTARPFAGYSITLRVVIQKDKSVLWERKTGVMADGGFTASLPAYNLPDGQYAFVFASPGQHGKETAAPAAASLAGQWYGIAGTAASPPGTTAMASSSPKAT